MIEKLLEYSHKEIKYMFFRDDRFTIVHGRTVDKEGAPHIMLGAAFCTREDEFRVDVGCHVALERFCKNLRLDREDRVGLHKALDFYLAEDGVKKDLRKALKERLAQFESEVLFGLSPGSLVSKDFARELLNLDPGNDFKVIIRMSPPRFGKKGTPPCL
jgi:hypothetical protein